MQYALEQAANGFNSQRDSCDSDPYDRGAKKGSIPTGEQYYIRDISIKLVTGMNGTIPKNLIQIADTIGSGQPGVPVRTFSLGPVDTQFRLDDQSYHLIMTAAAQITLEGSRSHGTISTSVDELTQLRLDSMKQCMMWQSSENKYYVELIQAGPRKTSDGFLVTGYLYFETDCSGKVIGEKPGWYPAMFSGWNDKWPASPASTLGLQLVPGERGLYDYYNIKWPCTNHDDLSWLSRLRLW